MTTKPPAILSFDNVTLGYNRHPAVHHLSGEVKKGSLLAVVGPNGAGKSTFLKGILRLLPHSEGAIQKSCKKRKVAFLPQASQINKDFPLTVEELVLSGFTMSHGFVGNFGKHRQKMTTALSSVGLTGFEKRPLTTLSGGQLQRALFARVMVQDAELILLDEPFAAIDQKTIADLLEIIKGWHTESRTIITVLHDLNLVREHFPDCLLLAREVIAWGKTADVLNEINLQKARSMAEAYDEDAHRCHVASPMAGAA